MLKTTFDSYIARFKELMVISKVLILVQTLLLVLTLLSQMFAAERNYVLMIVFGILIIIVSIVQWLIYAPAAFRTIQKRELGEAITVEQGITFQKKDIWNYFQLSITVFLVVLLISLPFMVAGLNIALAAEGATLLPRMLFILLLILGVVLYYFHLPKLVFVYNIYFVKNLSPKENFAESVKIGKEHRNTIWGFLIGVFVINFIGVLFAMIPGLFNQSQESVISTVWGSIVGMIFVTPVTYLYLSKAYAKIRAITEPLASNIPLKEEITQ